MRVIKLQYIIRKPLHCPPSPDRNTSLEFSSEDGDSLIDRFIGKKCISVSDNSMMKKETFCVKEKKISNKDISSIELYKKHKAFKATFEMIAVVEVF